ncbi:MAG: hypothetical protein ACI97A_000347 [Planctomycetota bacterium]|jgi:hypothetical protein
MEFLTELWLPIILSAVGVFVVSSIIHMATPMHKKDWAHLDGEEDILADMRKGDIKPGNYMFPAAQDMKDMSNPEYIAKCERGPVGYMIILPSKIWDMNKSLLHWFLYSLLISVMTAYVSEFALKGPQEFSEVFRLSGTVATIAYALASFPDSIWKGIKWDVTFRFMVDGIFYGLTTGAIFAAMWPAP